MYLDRLLSRVHHYHLFIEGDGNAGAGGGDPGAAQGGDKRALDGGNTGDQGGDPGSAAAGGEGGSLSSMVDGNAAATAPADWPEDWREKLAGGEDSTMALLKRLGSPADMLKKLLSQEQTIRRGAHKVAPSLPENATDEQLAEYRKAIGVPETPDGYGLKFAEELKPTEADTELLNGFLADMHRQHMPPAAAKAAFDWYQSHVGRLREEQAAAGQRQRHANEVELRKEHGADYMRNLRLADEFLDGYPGLKAIVHPGAPTELLRDVIALARASADEEALYGGDGSGGGKSLDDQIAEYRDKSIAGKLTPAENQKYNDLMAARIARDSKRSGRAA